MNYFYFYVNLKVGHHLIPCPQPSMRLITAHHFTSQHVNYGGMRMERSLFILFCIVFVNIQNYIDFIFFY
jgi:hypothetical protein